MKVIKEKFRDEMNIEVYVSKAGEQVLKYYKIREELNENFDKIFIEKNANAPFLAGFLQMNAFEFLLIAPATSNTVAKISGGISDTMLTNGAIQAMKASIPVFILPSDYREGEVVTELPSGKKLRLRVRKEDADNVEKLNKMTGITPFEDPREIEGFFDEISAEPQTITNN
jgi:archaeoflavoprotein AfpA